MPSSLAACLALSCVDFDMIVRFRSELRGISQDSLADAEVRINLGPEFKIYSCEGYRVPEKDYPYGRCFSFEAPFLRELRTVARTIIIPNGDVVMLLCFAPWHVYS